MAKIVDPDLLVKGTEITFLSGSKRIALNLAGNLSYDGVTLQAVYSKCKELWKSDETLIRYPFPLVSITEKKFDFIDGWDFTGSVPARPNLTRELIRDSGWAVQNAANTSTEEWMGFVSLGTIGDTDQVYIQQSQSGAPINVVFTGSVNEPVLIYASASLNSASLGFTDRDYRNYFKPFIRIQGKTYDASNLTAIGESSVTYQVYSFPLGNAADTKITNADSVITSSAPYTSMSIYYYTASVPRTIGAGTYQYNIIVDGNGGTKEQIYEFCQYQLRQDTNINSGSGEPGFLGDVVGKTADQLCTFVGDTLFTTTAVYIDNIQNTDINFYVFRDTGSNQRTFPYVAAGTITFNTNLSADPSSSYKMFFTSTPSSSFGSASAIIVQDKDGFPITGSTFGVSSTTFTFDYDFNTQGSRSAASDADVTLVAIGLQTGQYVSTVGTIQRTNANAFSLVAALERNYRNP
jgi:hypothetical protein